MALTDITTVRERGALKAPPVAGAVTDDQVNAAVRLAVHRMIEVCGFTLYSSVATIAQEGSNDPAWATPDPVTGRTDEQKLNDFIDAESYFAVARIEKISQIGKVTATGTPMSAQIGREIKTFAPAQEPSDTAEMWEAEAFKCLAPYLDATAANVADGAYPNSELAPVDTITNLPSMVSSANRKLRIAVCTPTNPYA